MKEYIKAIPVTTIILLYLYICGSLYLIGYWSYFDIDISNIVSFADVPKSFVMPFILSNGFYLLIAITDILIYHDGPNEEEYNISWFYRKKWRLVLHLDFWLSISPPLILLFYSYNKDSIFFWLATAIIFPYMVARKIKSIPLVKKAIPHFYLRNYTINIFFCTIFFSFILGRVKAIYVYKNENIKYAKAIDNNSISAISDSVPKKFLGFLGDKAIVSSLDNKTIIVLNQDKYDRIELTTNPVIDSVKTEIGVGN